MTIDLNPQEPHDKWLKARDKRHLTCLPLFFGFVAWLYLFGTIEASLRGDTDLWARAFLWMGPWASHTYVLAVAFQLRLVDSSGRLSPQLLKRTTLMLVLALWIVGHGLHNKLVAVAIENSQCQLKQ